MHTIDLRTTLLDKQSLDFIRIQYLMTNQKKHSKQTSITCKIISVDFDKTKIKYNEKRLAYVVFHVDCLKMLHKKNIEQSDIAKIKDIINKYLAPAKLSVDDLLMKRIDFCINLNSYREDEIECLFALLKGASNKISYLSKKGYKKAIRYTNGSKVYMIYFKPEHRQEYGQKTKLYEHVIRFEYQIKARHILYYKKKGLPSTYDAWMDTVLEKEFLQQGAKIFVAADYCNRALALNRIESSNYSTIIKNKLINYIDDIATSDIDTVKKRHSPDTNRKYMNILESINVNPILIGNEWGFQLLKSPFKSMQF